MDELDAPKPVVVVGAASNGNLLSPNIVSLLEVPLPNVRVAGLCGVPKVFVEEDVPNAEKTGPDDALLSVEPNILLVPPKAGVVCAFVTVFILGEPNAGVVVLKPGVTVLVETFAVMPNVDAVVVCVVELNNDVVVLPNIPPVVLALPKDVEGFVCPKISELLPNSKEGAVVVEVELALTLENKLELAVLFNEDTALVVEVNIEGVVVFGLVNKLVVVGDVIDATPKSG